MRRATCICNFLFSGLLRVTYVEAQVSGGVTVDDIEEVRFLVKSEADGEQVIQNPEVITLKSANPEIRFSYDIKK